MDPLSITASIAAIIGLTSKTIHLLSSIQSASKERTSCVIEVTNLQSYLLKLQLRLEDSDPGSTWFSEVRKLDVEDGPLAQCKRAVEELHDKLDGGNRFVKLGRTLVWHVVKDDVQKLLDKTERLKSLIQTALEMDHFKLSEALKGDIEELIGRSRDIKQDTEILRQSNDTKQHAMLMEWISDANYFIRHSDIISQQQEGTGQWFLESPMFQGWIKKPQQTLFCPGMPGAGKTMISAIAIDHLLNKMPETSDVGVCFIYFNYKTRADQSVTTVLAAMLKQLLQTRPSSTKPLENLHARHASKQSRPSLHEISQTLQAVLNDYSTVYTIIDALDECAQLDNTRHQFLSQLKALQSKADVRLMFTSRFILEIQIEFAGKPTLEIRANDDDVRKFVVGRTDRLAKCIQRNNDLQLAVLDRIVGAVDGMFLLAQLYMDSLQDKSSPKAVRQAIKRFSVDTQDLTRLYDNAYNDAMQRIEHQLDGHRELAKKTLSWITYAKRPLVVSELCHALAVELGDEDIDLENIYDIEDAVSACAGLVTIDEESNIVRLVHYTTQEYFERVRHQRLPSAELLISLTCLTYLSFTAFQSGPSTDRQKYVARLAKYPFLRYAALFWGHHCVPVEEEVIEQALNFLLHPSLISSAIQGASGGKIYFPRRTALHLTAEHGLISISEKLLPSLTKQNPNAIDEKDDKENTPLMAAVPFGQYEMARWLVNKDADISIVNNDRSFPTDAMYMAAIEGHSEIVRLLVDAGAWVNNGALQAATRKGHEQIVKLLLDSGCDVNSPDPKGDIALRIASLRGYEQIARHLIEKGADVNQKDENGRYALSAAAEYGHLTILQLLLDKGAEVNPQQALEQSGALMNNPPLLWCDAFKLAAFEWREQIVELSFANGADFNVEYDFNRGGHHLSPLQAACHGGSESIVKMVLEHGADINAHGSEFCTALWAAATWCQKPFAMAQLLLDRGVDINVEIGQYGNALTSAAERGAKDAVQMLLEKGADANAQSGFFGNALQAASNRGHAPIVQLLSENGADVNLQGGSHDTALKAACYRNQTWIAQLLLDAGANVNAKSGENSSTALFIAIQRGSKKMVQLLLDRGADINIRDGFDCNPLQAAVICGATGLVSLLIENGADIHAQGGFYGNALQAASMVGCRESVQRLLDLGVDVNSRGGHYGSALRAASVVDEWNIVQLLLDHGATEEDQSDAN